MDVLVVGFRKRCHLIDKFLVQHGKATGFVVGHGNVNLAEELCGIDAAHFGGLVTIEAGCVGNGNSDALCG